MARDVPGRRQVDWLPRQPAARSRRWALEEQLFGGRDRETAPAVPERRAIVAPGGDPWADTAFTLSHCQDFLAVDARGHTGVVADVRFRSRVDRPDELGITFGRLRPRVVWVPVGEVQWISSADRELALACELPVARRLEGTRQRLARRHLTA